jgi:hypothetical protein
VLHVSIPNNFLPERKYIVQTMLQHYLGIEVAIETKPGVIHYELSWSDRKITIMDQFFGQTIIGHTYAAADRIPGKMVASVSPDLHGAVIIYGQDNVEVSATSVTSHVDLFAGAFFMLTRWEESIGFHEDQHGRFPAERALTVRSGMITRPIVDEYVALLKNWLLQLGYPVPASKFTYRNVPTADVDIPSYWLRTPRWRVIAGEWLKRKNFSSINDAHKMIASVERGEVRDPYDTFDYMMTAAENAGLRFEFNMLVGGISKFEGFYSIQQPHIQTLMRTIQQRGHHIGLHPSYNTFHDRRLLREEKQRLEKALDTTITSSRQHYLKFAVPKTWQLLSDEGIRVDSTMYFAAAPGFRCGTCKPFPVFDIQQRLQLPLIERPLLIMEVSFRNYLQLSPEASINLIDTIHAQVKKHDGEFIWLWHNSNLSEIEGWEPWKNVFQHLLKLA